MIQRGHLYLRQKKNLGRVVSPPLSYSAAQMVLMKERILSEASFCL